MLNWGLFCSVNFADSYIYRRVSGIIRNTVKCKIYINWRVFQILPFAELSRFHGVWRDSRKVRGVTRTPQIYC